MIKVLKVFSEPFAKYSRGLFSKKPQSVYHESALRLIKEGDLVFKEKAKVYKSNLLRALFLPKIEFYNKLTNRTFLEPFDPKKDYSKIELQDIK